ncbi:hypothetical protein Taro_013517 [Colocasia esculenta]|uniref:Uncharacterized protein n=1 Tax=Colocasia esculenta TaxID=4460 RepID=A0A843UFS0_COLES|nr:hypothetical protein [Colocasia esculenta]
MSQAMLIFYYKLYISTVAKPVPPEKTVIDEKPLELVTITKHLRVPSEAYEVSFTRTLLRLLPSALPHSRRKKTHRRVELRV